MNFLSAGYVSLKNGKKNSGGKEKIRVKIIYYLLLITHLPTIINYIPIITIIIIRLFD